MRITQIVLNGKKNKLDVTEITMQDVDQKGGLMEYELKLDDLLKSLTELGIDTDKLTIVEKSEKFDEQDLI